MTTTQITGRVYCIRNHVDDKIYIGSTIQKLSERMTKHRSRSKKEEYKGRKIYKHMNEFGVENFYIELIEEAKFDTKDEMRARENHFIRQFDSFKNGLNGCGAILDIEHRKEYIEQWREENKEYNKR